MTIFWFAIVTIYCTETMDVVYFFIKRECRIEDATYAHTLVIESSHEYKLEPYGPWTLYL